MAGGGHGPGGNQNHGFQKPKNTMRTITRLLGYLTKSKLPLVMILVALVISVGSNLGGSYMLRGIINNFIYEGGSDVAGLTTALLSLVCLYLLGALASYGQSAMMVRLAQKGVNRLRKELFDKMQELPLSYFDKHPHGEVMSRFTNDADNVQLALEQSIVSMISSVLMFVGLVGLMLFINWKLFLVTAVILVVTMQVFKLLGGRSRKYYRQQQSALGAVNGDIQEIIEGLKVVKAFTHEEQAKTNFEALNRTYQTAATSASFYSTALMPIASNLMNIGYAITAGLGGALAALQGFDLGGLIIYLNYSRQIGQPLNQISQQMTSILSCLAGAERIFEVMDMEPEVDGGDVTLVPAHKDENGALVPNSDASHGRSWAWRVPKTSHIRLVPITISEENDPVELPNATGASAFAWKYDNHEGVSSLHPIRGAVVDTADAWYCELRGAVRFTHVDFSYVAGKRILKDVSVYANPGQKIAFVGSTGAGKTTITNLINRFYEIEGGMITYDGINVVDMSKNSLRRSLGMVLQDTHLFTGSIMDNIRYGRMEATDDECIAAAKIANAHSFIRRLPDGYHTEVTGDGGNLSQGQRQLLAIARAAVAAPPVLILDEATSSIDTRTERQIERGMDALMEGRTVFVIAHRLSTVRNSDCIVVMEHGQIEERGNHHELLAEEGRYFRLYTGQFQMS